jgi:hypothetical protein
VRAAALRPSPKRSLKCNSSSGWTRAARCCLILLACLAQSLVIAQHRHAPVIASYSTVAATESAPQLANIDLEKSRVLCAPDFAHAGSSGHGAPLPCQEDNCPCCPPVNGATAILPFETARAVDPPRLSKTIAPPAFRGALPRLVSVDGQPRAPPIPV